MRFIDTVHCVERRVCAVCRDLKGGRAWRKGMGVFLDLPGGVDFECPFGIPWGEREVVVVTYPAERKAVCYDCSYKPRCSIWRAGRCGGLLSRRTMECPEGKWGPEKLHASE